MAKNDKNSIIIIIGALCFIFGVLGICSYEELDKRNLSEISITLKSSPEYSDGKYPDYSFSSNEYQKPFQISGFVLEAVNEEKLLELNAGDKLTVYIDKSDIVNLNEERYINNYIEIYQLDVSSSELIDLDEINRLAKNDTNIGYIFIVISVISFFYLLLKKFVF